jgi:hypothetical protein
MIWSKELAFIFKLQNRRCYTVREEMWKQILTGGSLGNVLIVFVQQYVHVRIIIQQIF